MKSYIILIPVLLLIIVLSIMSGGVTPEIRPVAISGGILIFIISLLVDAFSFSYSLPSDKLFLVPLVLILASIAVQASAPVLISGRIPLLEIVAYSLLVFAIMLSHPSPRAVILFILSLSAWGIILVGYGLVQRLSIAGDIGNITATFINRNHFCAFIGMIAPLSLGLAMWAPGRLIRWLSGGFFLVLSAGVILTGSRGGVTAFGISIGAVMLLYLLRHKGNKRVWIYLFLAAIMGGILISVLLLPVRGDLSPITETSLSELSVRTRFSIWQSTFSAFLDRPWTGWGWGSFPYIYPLFKAPGVWYQVPHAHNELIQLLAEGGLIGFFGLAFCYIYLFIYMVRLFRYWKDGIFKALSSGVIGVLIYALIHSFFDFIFRLPANAFLLAGIVGIGLSISLPSSRPIVVLGRKTGWLISLAAIIFLTGLVLLPMIKYYRSYKLYQQGMYELTRRQSLSALDYFAAAIDLVPDISEYHMRKAMANMQLFDNTADKIGLFDEIISSFEVAGRINPWDAAIPWHQAKFFRRIRAYSQAAENFNEALRQDPTNPFIQMDQARLDFDRGQLDSAAKWLRRAAGNYPSVGSDCIEMIFARTSDYRILEQVPPPVAWLHRQLGYKLREKGMWEEAGKEFRKALSLDPQDPANWLARGEADLLLERYNDAIAAFEKASSINSLDGYAWSRLGEVYLKLDKKETALRYLRKAWDCESDGRKYSKRLYSVVKDIEGNAAAREFMGKVSAKSPEWGWPYSALATISMEEDDYGSARREINEALKRDPDHPYYRKIKKRIEVGYSKTSKLN